MSYYGFGYFAFIFSSDKTLRDVSKIQELLTKIGEMGWKFISSESNTHSTKRNIIDSSSDDIKNAWQKSISEGEHGAIIEFCNSKDFTAGLGLDFEHHYRKLLVTTNYGDFDECNPLAADHMRSAISLCETVYQTLAPVYGYGLTSQENVTLEEYLDTTPHIYAIFNCNFFGPDIVSSFGRERLLSIPTWRTLEFPDGGILLEMRPYPPTEGYDKYKPNYEYTTKMLGIETYRLGV